MDLRDYLAAVRKRWWLVVSAAVVALGAAVLVTVLTPPKYAATVTFFVSAQTKGSVTDAYQGDLFSQKRVASYVDLLTSERLAKMIVENQPIGLTADEVQGRITAEAIPNTVLLRATVTDRDGAQALRLTQTLATQFAQLIQTLETPPGESTPSVRVDVVAGPRLGATPVSPTPLRNVGLGLVLGLIAGVGAAALREAMDTSVKTGAMLNELTLAPVLTAVPFDARAKKAPLIIEGSARSTRAEAMRQLRTNLRFVDVDKPAKTIVVTSAVPGEGKSTTACNLAIVFAEAGKRVVLVDADLRRPRLAEYLGLEGAVGLTDVLVGHTRLDAALQQWGSTAVHVLPSGSVPPNPSELLGSRNMADLLATLRIRFDIVIVDTPPLLPVTDAAVLAAVVDGTLLVARCTKTTAAQAKSAATALEAVDGRLLGCVLNMAPSKGSETYTYYEYRPSPPARHSRRVEPDLPSVPAVPTAGGPPPLRTVFRNDTDTESNVDEPVPPPRDHVVGSGRVNGANGSSDAVSVAKVRP